MALATAAPVPLSILSSLFHCHILVFLLQQGQGWAVSLHLLHSWAEQGVKQSSAATINNSQGSFAFTICV